MRSSLPLLRVITPPHWLIKGEQSPIKGEQSPPEDVWAAKKSNVYFHLKDEGSHAYDSSTQGILQSSSKEVRLDVFSVLLDHTLFVQC